MTNFFLIIFRLTLVLNFIFPAKVMAADVENKKHNLEQQLIELHDQQQHCADELKEHKQRFMLSESKIEEHAQAFKKNYARHEQELSSFAKQLQQVMYWKIKRKNNIFSTVGRSDHVAKSYLWKGVLNQEQSVLKNQIDGLESLLTDCLNLEDLKNYHREQANLQEDLLLRLNEQKNQMESLLEELVLMQQKDLAKKITNRSKANTFDLKRICPPLSNIQKRDKKEFLGASILAGKRGDSIKAMAEGTVIFSDYLKGLGHVIMVEHGQGYLSVYGNCHTLGKKVGDPVILGEQIALLGQSGQIGRDALYFEFRKDGQIIAIPEWDHYS